jgi:hypothetical protein
VAAWCSRRTIGPESSPSKARISADSAHLLFCAHILDWRNPFAAILG